MVRGDFLSGGLQAHLEAPTRRLSERHGIARRAETVLRPDDGRICETAARPV